MSKPKVLPPLDYPYLDGNPLYYPELLERMQRLTGRVLTIVDAIISDPRQNKAAKDVMRDALDEAILSMRERAYGGHHDSDGLPAPAHPSTPSFPEEREHLTDGQPCWCDPQIIHVSKK